MSDQPAPRRRVCGDVVVDTEVNAATITFDDQASGRTLVDYPIRASNGDVIAVLTFTGAGRLAGLELLDAATQLPT